MIIILVTGALAGANNRILKSELLKQKIVIAEPDYIIQSTSRDVCPAVYPNNFNSLMTVVDSSNNGYGMISSMTHPLDVNSDNEWVVAYRQFSESTSGQLGAAYSSDGLDWQVEYNINADMKGARFPNAIASQDESYVFWWHYSYGDGNASEFEEGHWYRKNGEDPIFINVGGNSDASTAYGYDSANSSEHIFILIDNVLFTYEDGFAPLATVEENGILSMNDNGYGIFGLGSVVRFNLTHDWGTTWQSYPNDFYYPPDELFEDILSFWPDQVDDPCTGTDEIDGYHSWHMFDMRVDQYGNPHIIMSMVATSEWYFHFLDGYTGWYHLTIDKDFIDNPGSINSSTGWNWSYIPLPANDSFRWLNCQSELYTYTMCQLSFSRDNPDIVYAVANIGTKGEMSTDYDADGDGIIDNPCVDFDCPQDLYPNWSEDIWAAKSTDGGSTWSAINNLTMTPRSGTDDICSPEEQFVHTAHWSDDNSVRYVYQQPDWSYNEVGEQDGASHKNRIFVGYSFIGDGGCDGEGNVMDDCGVCGGGGLPDGECDCEGNVMDECGVCGGDGTIFGDTGCCEADVDECGLCGGDNSSCSGCTDPEVSNYDPDATYDDGSCLYLSGFTFIDSYENNYYYISNLGGNYIDGVELCWNYNGHLVTVTTQAENDFVLNALMEYGGGSNHLWLGLDDLNDDGVYAWITGETVDYTNWSTYPSSGNAIEMNTPSGNWGEINPYSNSNYRRYMCEGEIELGDAFGCTETEACNYNINATEDDGSCIYAEENYDCEGNCIADEDCAGECGGSAVVDCADECGGSAVVDCAGECGGSAVVDCADECGGDAVVDESGECSTPTECGAELGDVNADGIWNVLDIVQLANCILADNCSDLPNGCAGDMDGGGGYNVLDIVTLVMCVLEANCDGR